MTDLRCYVPRLDCQPADACPDIAEIDGYKIDSDIRCLQALTPRD